MSVEKITYVKRTLWVARCPVCEFRKEDHQPRRREIMCPDCKVWVPFEAISYTGPEGYRHP